MMKQILAVSGKRLFILLIILFLLSNTSAVWALDAVSSSTGTEPAASSLDTNLQDNKIDLNLTDPRIERLLNQLPPHLKDSLKSNPQLLGLILNTPREELRHRLLKGDVPGDISPQILRELAHQIDLMKISPTASVQKISSSDSAVRDLKATSGESTLDSSTDGGGQFVEIAGGGNHTIALKNDDSIWTWGANWDGQLGDGTITDRLTPVQVSGLSGITAISGGLLHSIALKNDGTVWAWGYNSDG